MSSLFPNGSHIIAHQNKDDIDDIQTDLSANLTQDTQQQTDITALLQDVARLKQYIQSLSAAITVTDASGDTVVY